MATRRTTPFKATKLGTIGRSSATLPVLAYNNKRRKWFSNSRLVKALKENPMSYKLPPEYIWNTASNKIEEADEWFRAPLSRRVLREDLEDVWSVNNGNFLEPAFLESNEQNAFGGIINSFEASVHRSKQGNTSLLGTKIFKSKFAALIERHHGLRFYWSFKIKWYHTPTREFKEDWMSSKGGDIFDIKQLPTLLAESNRDIKRKIAALEMAGSGWQFQKAVKISLQVNKYLPMRGGGTFIPTPDFIKKKKAVVNVNNDKAVGRETRCFEFAMLAVLHYDDLEPRYKKHRDKWKAYEQWFDEVNFEGVEFPVCPNDGTIDKIERQNNIAINLYQYHSQKKIVSILRRTKLLPTRDGPQVKTVNLLYLDENKHEKFHYCAITNWSRLMGKQINNHKCKMYNCHHCLRNFQTEGAYKRHQGDCAKHEAIRTEMPPAGSKMKFKNWNNKVRGPGIIYADFEATNVYSFGCQPSPNGTHTTKVATQTANSYKLTAVCINGKTRHRRHVMAADGEDIMGKFFEDVVELETELREDFQQFRAIEQMTGCDDKAYRKETHCHICEEPLFKRKSELVLDEADLKDFATEAEARNAKWETVKRVRDHCHTTGKYLGAAHSKCNIGRTGRWFKIPVVFHNLKGYDAHYIIQEATKLCKRRDAECATVDARIRDRLGRDDLSDEEMREERKKLGFKKKPSRMDVIPLNSEKYLSFTCGGLKFLDSAAFMADSLDNLAGNLKDDEKVITKQYFKDKGYTNRQIKLLLKKGVYPYAWVDSVERFKATELPPIEVFRNDLSGKDCEVKSYEHAQLVWKELKCKTFQDYHDLYLDCDVNLLADIFEAFRTLTLKHHRLDPAYYITAPGLSWDAMLYKTRIQLELISDQELHLMFEKAVLGGLSYIGHRKGNANNKHMGDAYDPNKKSKYLMYWDANNLYGKAMTMPLAYKDFQWIDSKEWFELKDDAHNLAMVQALCQKPKQAGGDHKGYIFEVDLDYPEKLHDKHRSFPLLPEQIRVVEDDYSDYQHIACLATDSKESTVSKLIPSLRDKRKYVLDIRMLRFAMEQGLQLKKIHRAVQFTQKDYMRPYIDMNSKLRAEAVRAGNKFQKAYFKLLNNSVFGKTMENVRNRVEFEVITTEQRMESMLRNPRLKRTHIFNKPGDDSVVGAEVSNLKVTLDKPIYAGLQILNLSKIVMYDFHYNHVLKAYDHNKIKLLFTDTDSLCYEIETDDVYKDMAANKHLRGTFDFSNYPETHPLYSTQFEAIPGYFKDELEGSIMTEFIGLRSKMYSYMKMDGKFANTHKGIKDSANIQHDEYRKCLDEMKNTYAQFNCLRSRNHQIIMSNISKKALCCFDDKTYILDDGVETLPWGHYKIKSHDSTKMFPTKAEAKEFVQLLRTKHEKLVAALKAEKSKQEAD